MIPIASFEDEEKDGMICFSSWVWFQWHAEERRWEEGSLLVQLLQEMRWRRRVQCGFSYINGFESNCGPHWPPKFQRLKTPICGSWMKSMKKRKMIVEKSSFQKVYFPHDFQILKFMHKLSVKRQICPFSRKTWILGFEYKWIKYESCWDQNSKSKNIKINIF